MPFVTDSRIAGYLGPKLPGPYPLCDDEWEDFLHDVFAGVTGLPGDRVRPAWQEEPPLRPDFSTDWMAFGTIATRRDFAPVTIHIDDGADGYDAMQEMEELDIKCSFYGPHSEAIQSYFQRGLYVDQNQAVFRANAVGIVSCSGYTRAAEFFKERWWPRSDVTVTLRREVRYNYNVLNLLRAQVDITAQPPGNAPVIHDDADTANVDPIP